MSKLIFLIALLALLGFAAPAGAVNPIIRDCTNSLNGELQGTYSRRDLREALKDVTGDLAEYTNCSDAINNALRRSPRPGDGDGTGGDGSGSNGTGDGSGGGLGGGTGSGESSTTGGGGVGGSGSTGGGSDGGGTGGDAATPPPAPVTPQPGSSEPVKLAGTAITPSIPATLDRNAHELPTPLIGFLVLFGAGAVGVAATTIGRRVLARRRS